MARSLTYKVTAAALAFLVVLAITLALAVNSILTTRDAVTNISAHALEHLQVSSHFNLYLSRAIAEAQSFSQLLDPVSQAQAEESLRQAQDDLALLAETNAENESRDPSLIAEHTKIQERREAILRGARQELTALERAIAANDQPATRQAVAAFEELEEEVEQLEDNVAGLIDAETTTVIDLIRMQLTRGLYGSGLFFGLITLLALLALFVVHRQVVRPIRRLSDAADRVASGDLNHTVTVASTDEIGILQSRFNRMVSNLRAQQDELTQQRLLIEQRASELEQTVAELSQTIAERDELSRGIREVSSPVLPIAPGLLVMPLIGVFDTQRAAIVTSSLLRAIEEHRAEITIIDVTGVPLIDTQVAQVVLTAAAAARLLGAQTILVGLRPELAQTIVGLGMNLTQLVTLADLHSGISYALQRQRR